MLAPSEALDFNVLPARARRPPLLKSGLEFRIALLLCLASISHVISAQEIQPDEVVKMRTDIVTVPVVVIDSHGRRVFGLEQDNFVVSSERQPQRVGFFATGASRVALVFLLDASGSAREYLGDQRDAALSLFSRFGPQSEVAVLRFSDSTTVAAPFSTDTRAVREGFDFPAVSGRHTAIFNGAMAALQLLSERKQDPTERRIVILTSDGLDTASKVKASDVIERARQDDVSLFVIHFPIYSPQGGHLRSRPTARGFRDLADKTGGQYFVATDAASALTGHVRNDLSTIFKAIADDLAGQYLLGFYPDESLRDSRQHAIEVRLTKKVHGLRVKALRDEFRLAY